MLEKAAGDALSVHASIRPAIGQAMGERSVDIWSGSGANLVADVPPVVGSVRGRPGAARVSRQPEELGSRHGTQAIERATLLLRLLTRRGRQGSRLCEVTKESGLSRPTVWRILKCLSDQRLVDHDPVTGRYRLGPLNFELGLAVPERLEFREILRPTLERIAKTTGDTVYLQVRSGFETVCVDRVNGATPLRGVVLDLGGRRPMAFSSAGIAILAQLSDVEVNNALDALGQDFANSGRVTRAQVLQSITRARVKGYGIVRDTTVIGVAAIAVAALDKPQLPVLSIAIAMPDERLTPSRAASLHQLLTEEITRV